MNKLPTRRSNRLKTFDYTSNNTYFITFCVRDGQCLLWERQAQSWTHALSEWGQVVSNAIETIDGFQSIHLGPYVIMPNHVHAVINIDACESDRRVHLSNVVRFIKSSVTKTLGQSIWQKSYYDHVVRDEKEYKRIWEYIENNPDKWKEDRYYQP